MLPDGINICAPTILECTRFCHGEKLLKREQEEVVFASMVLTIALYVALKAGIESIIGNFDAAMLPLYRRIDARS